MKRVIKTIIACTMTVVMAAMSPLTDLAPKGEAVTGAPVAKAATVAKAAGKKVYISEIKLGQGLATDDEKDNGKNCKKACTDLLSEGYTILTDDSGKYADLNENAGDDDEGRNGLDSNIVVYLGYKTTTDPSQAITDLAVMNMEGGYDVQRYDEMLKQNMESKIKPFMKKFLLIIKEYRENIEKNDGSNDYIRANCMREMLNKIHDDDCDGAGLGDLLLNETKFEMGDAAYNSLSEAEKKQHADIITIFQQGNEALIYCMTNALSKSADTSDDTWIDRMLEADYKELEYEVIRDNPKLSTKNDIANKLDKLYEDGAKAILSHWDDVSKTLNSVDEAAEKVDSYDEEVTGELEDEIGDVEAEELTEDQMDEIEDQATDCIEAADAGVTVTVADFLESKDYEFNVGGRTGSTLLDFFKLDSTAFKGTNIRELYPLVSVLSEGQVAGLDFLSIRDLIAVGMDDREGYRSAEIDKLEDISLYQGVNREIFEEGGVALTSDAMRKNAARDDSSTEDPAIAQFTALWIAIGCAIIFSVMVVVWIFNMWSKFGKVISIIGDTIGAIAVVAAIVGLVMYLVNKTDIHKIDFKSIPKYMVDELDVTEKDAKGRKVFIRNQTAYYKAVTCNRKVDSDAKNISEQKKNLEILSDRGDLNGDVGRQWLALYAVKYENGYPILADSLRVKKGTSDPPSGYKTGIHMFGSKSIFNLNNTAYLFGALATPTYVYYKNDTSTVEEMVAGSVFSTGSAAIGAGVGILLGGILGFLVAILSRRRKKYPEEPEEA